MGKILLPLVRRRSKLAWFFVHTRLEDGRTVGRQVQVAPTPTNRLLHVTPPGFGALKVHVWRSDPPGSG